VSTTNSPTESANSDDQQVDFSPLLAHVPGASNVIEDEKLPTAWHYGDPLGEQNKVEAGATGLIDRWDRVAIWVHGPEARTWLNDMISQKVNAIADGQASFGLVLDGQGRVEHHFGIAALPGGLLLDVSSQDATSLQDYLTKMVFWSDVTIERLPLRQVGVLKKMVGDADTIEDAAGTGETPGGEFLAAHSWRTRMMGDISVTDVWVPEEQLIAQWDHATDEGLVPTGLMAYTAWRVAARQVVVGVDTDEKTIPHEVAEFVGEGNHAATQLASADAGPTAHAVHLNKGCYRGQETVSRVQNLGKSPRILVMLHLDGSKNELPEVGADVTAGGRTIGRVGTSVHDSTYGPIALALVRRNVVEKLAKDASAVPALKAGEVDASIDSADVKIDNSERPGRAAIKNLRQR